MRLAVDVVPLFDRRAVCLRVGVVWVEDGFGWGKREGVVMVVRKEEQTPPPATEETEAGTLLRGTLSISRQVQSPNIEFYGEGTACSTNIKYKVYKSTEDLLTNMLTIMG